MKKYRRLQATLIALVVGTFALGMVSAVRPAGEIFPFASWFLFSLVPQRVTSYEIRVTEWNGQKFSPPRSIIDVDGLLQNPRSSTVFQLVQRYCAGSTLENGLSEDAKTAWALLSSRMATPKSLFFDVMRITYDPIERSSTGRMISEDWVSASFIGTTEVENNSLPTPKPETKP